MLAGMMKRFLFLQWLVGFCAALMVEVVGGAEKGERAGETSLAEPLPRFAPTEPGDVGGTFEVLDGFEMQLLASEPMVTDPVAMVYDENGLAYVAEMNDYPHVDQEADIPFKDQHGQPPQGRVRVLKDRDGDGVFDESFIFAEELSWPAGLANWKGGIFVGATPDVWYLKDTDGDHVADVREKVLTGFRKYNVQAVMNNLKWGLDHRIYGAAAGNGGLVRRANEAEKKAVRVSQRDFRFDPLSGAFDVLSGGARFGNAFDDWGNRFICNIRNPVQHVVLPNRYLARNPYLPVEGAIHDCAEAGDQLPVYPISEPEPWRVIRAKRWGSETDRKYPRSETTASGSVTSSSGVTVYRGGTYPEAYRGNVFLGEVAGNLIHRQTLEPDGVTFVAKRADAKSEFVRSRDNWFRPVNFVNAPDGTLHVLDMYRETIEHPWSIPDDIKALLDLRSGRDRGRIYRLAPPGFRAGAPPRLGDATVGQLVDYLNSPHSWTRETAHRLLFERQDEAAVGPLRALLRDGRTAVGRLHAMWSLAGLNGLRAEDVAVGLANASGRVREHAAAVAESRFDSDKVLLDAVLALANDGDARVRFQAAFSLGQVKDPRAMDALARIARRDGGDSWMRTAVVSGVADSAPALLTALLSPGEGEAAGELLNQLGLIAGVRNQPGEIVEMVEALLRADEGTRFSVVSGLGAGLRRRGLTLSAVELGPNGAGAMLDGMLDAATAAATNLKVAMGKRVESIELLGFYSFDRVGETLGRLLDSREPPSVQMSAVGALSGFKDESVAAILLKAWRGFTPTVRAVVTEALTARPERIESLLSAISIGEVMPAQIGSTKREFLLTHRDATIRSKAASVLGGLGSADRERVIVNYQSALSLEGNATRGGVVFERLCMTCHRHGGRGNDMGPGLETVQHRTRENVMMHILDPNREVAPSYVSYAIYLKGGDVAAGVIGAETANSISLRRPENVMETILRSDIDEIVSSGKSIMPEGLEEGMTHREMADLLSFLLDSPKTEPASGSN
jgi:putative membrane-bound dehydrogenase-like protein